jgi:hypothetical protein
MNKKLAAALGFLIINSGLNAAALETVQMLAGFAFAYHSSEQLHKNLQIIAVTNSPRTQKLRSIFFDKPLSLKQMPTLANPVIDMAQIVVGITLIKLGMESKKKKHSYK